MPSDEYASAGGGALRIKGAKVKKHKKKKARSDLEKNLATGEPSSSSKNPEAQEGAEERDGAREEEGKEDAATAAAAAAVGREDEDTAPSRSHKTEAERRFDEVRRKKLLELAESANSRPELLKTHKERVEELNTYLSKLSEHHDMPKIGPG